MVNTNYAFKDPSLLNSQTRSTVENSLEVINYDPIVGDVALPAADELKEIIAGSFGSQNRAVTEQDYKALTYSMPPRFGSIKRCSIYRDSDSFKRNINLYVMSQDSNGHLVNSNINVKTNLKTWLGQNKIINDTIDILDAKVVNIQIKYTAVSVMGVNNFDVLANANNALKRSFSQKMNIGESLNIGDIYTLLNGVTGIADVRNVEIVNVTSTGYSSINLSMRNNITADGRFIRVPKNVVLEIKYPDTDIIGTIS